MKELVKIQSELKAPKSQYNKFGNYAYRSAEDILEAVKPLTVKHDCCLTVSDNIIMLGDRFYIEATARIVNAKGEAVEVTALAREADSQKGMAEPQITGSTSSYARKYALNGLFCIDDTKDADYTNMHGMDGADKPKASVTPKAVAPKAVAPKAVKAKTITPKVEDIPKEVRQRIADATKREDVASVWKDFANLRNNQEFNELVKQASAQFPKK